MKCGRILRIKVLGYTDEAALVDSTVTGMTTRLTKIADASQEEADMKISVPKTFTQHVHEREEIAVTTDEVAAIEAKYAHKCDFCERSFKTRRGMLIHRARCQYNYNTTDEVFVLEDIVGMFGHRHSRWFKVKWQGHEEAEWKREHLLARDGCADYIRDFWSTSGLQPNKDFYPDPNGVHKCTVCCEDYSRAQDLKAHRTRTKHYESKNEIKTKTAVKDAVLTKRIAMQNDLPKVQWKKRWTTQDIENCWRFKYLGIDI